MEVGWWEGVSVFYYFCFHSYFFRGHTAAKTHGVAANSARARESFYSFSRTRQASVAAAAAIVAAAAEFFVWQHSSNGDGATPAARVSH